MSGPKTSHYTLTQEQRRILAEQRKIRIEREMLTKQLGDIRSVIAEADRIIEQIEPLYVEILAGTTTLSQAKAMRKEATNALSQASSVSDIDGSAKLREVNKTLRATAQKLTAITNAVKTEHASAEKSFRSAIADSIDGGFDFTFDIVGDISAISRNPYAQKIQAELESLCEFFLTAEHREKEAAIKAKLLEINDPDFLKNYYAMTVIPFVKECRAYNAAYNAYGEEYERKRYIYEANAKAIGIVAEEIPFSADAVALLDTKINETDEIIRHRDEQAYISQCVDEAMQEMGYTVVGNREVVRRNGKRFRNELYLFDEGTAVNVTYSSDGQITMELGGISTDDRLPTEAESASLASDMCTFCDDYYEIEHRLRKKGIVTKRISILPPEEQYAQIINVSDYSLSTEVSEYEAKGAKRHTAKSKTQRIGE